MFALRALSVVCAASILGPVTTARAEADQEPIRLEYVADAGCPSEREFERMVFQRTHSARPAANTEMARTFRVTLRNNGTWVHGSLTVREGEQNLVRQVNGRSCSELASVLALATALAIDPLAEISPDPGATAAQPGDAESSGRRTTGPADAPSSAITSKSGPGNPASKESGSGLSVYDPPDPIPTDETTTDWAFTFGPTLAWAATPHAALGPSMGVEFRTREPGWAVGATFNGLFTAARSVDGAEADFRLLTAAFHGCGLTRAWPDGIHGGICLHAQLGDLYARSTDIPFPESVHNFWATVGIHLRVAVDLSTDWWLHANVGPSLSLTRYRFVFNEPDTPVFQQGMWTGTAQLLLGYRL